jgi:lipopolysaccharide export system protein LptA
VKGTPSRFSHQVKDSAQRSQGRAATIDYDAQADVLQLSGDTWYSSGRYVVETAALTYHLKDGSFSSNESVKASIEQNKRVPPPRTPDRATSQ